MKEYFEHFLTNWWLGLLEPLAASKHGYNLLTWNDASQSLDLNTSENQTRSNKNYYCVPAQQVLCSSIEPSQSTENLKSIISAALPFNEDEVYAMIHENTLLAVLKSDIKPIESAATSQGYELFGLILEHAQGSSSVELYKPKQTLVSLTKFSATLGLLILIASALLWTYSKNQQQTITHLENQLQSIAPVSNIAELSIPNLSQTHPEDLLKALQTINTTIGVDTNIKHLQLHSSSLGLSVILDAESSNAAVLLGLFEQSSNFQNSEFVTAISSDSENTVERFRLKTDYLITNSTVSYSEVSDD